MPKIINRGKRHNRPVRKSKLDLEAKAFAKQWLKIYDKLWQEWRAARPLRLDPYTEAKVWLRGLPPPILRHYKKTGELWFRARRLYIL